MKLFVVVITAVFIWMGNAAALAGRDPDSEPLWSVFAYGGRWSDNRFLEIIRGSTEMKSSHLWAVGGSRTIYEIGDHILLEGELNTAVHSGEQSHIELNSALSFRYGTFPWDEYLNTTIAYGLGLSLASTPPPIEEKPGKPASRLLLFMPAELTVGPPRGQGRNLEFMIRVHHRSGAFGLFRDASGSNFITGGFRYRF